MLLSWCVDVCVYVKTFVLFRHAKLILIISVCYCQLCIATVIGVLVKCTGNGRH